MQPRRSARAVAWRTSHAHMRSLDGERGQEEEEEEEEEVPYRLVTELHGEVRERNLIQEGEAAVVSRVHLPLQIMLIPDQLQPPALRAIAVPHRILMHTAKAAP
jgi:hypothetical protein